MKKLSDIDIKELVGNHYNMLTVVEYLGYYVKEDTRQKRHWYKCLCECGNETITHRCVLLNGGIKSCGCLVKIKIKEMATSHGMRKTKIYKKYADMRKRCYNPHCERYSNYGGRGIKVCEDWLQSFENFYTWAINNNYSDELSLDRIDVNGDYEPINCRWVTLLEQSRNKQNTVYMTINGKTKKALEWAEISGIDVGTLKVRYNSNNYPKDKMFDKPKHTDKVILSYQNKEYTIPKFCKTYNIPLTSFRRLYYERCVPLDIIVNRYNKESNINGI